MSIATFDISIIIPVLNEANTIATTIRHLKENCLTEQLIEILVVDGGSTDATNQIAEDQGARVVSSPRGRAAQMNYGAMLAKGSILYFLHADTIPPKHFDKSITQAIHRGYQAGCFQMKFDSNSRFLSFFAWFSRINSRLCRGGDQSLFISKKLFDSLNGFNEDYRIYEDNEFIGRLYDHTTKFKILPQQVKTSARRYEECGTLKLQYHYGIIHLKSRFGNGPEQLYRYYRKHIG